MNQQPPARLENETVEAYIVRLKQSGFSLRGNAKVLRPGHKYQLKNFEDPNSFQILQFIEKEPKMPGSPELITVNDGTTNEAVLEMLIDRAQQLFNKFPSPETASAIDHMRQALEQFELRTLRRLARGVEGQAKA